MPVSPDLRRPARLAPFALGTLLLSACLGISETQDNNRYGSVTITASGGNDGAPVAASVAAAFFTGGTIELPTSVTTTDVCSSFSYSPETFSPGNLDAGSTLQLSVAGQPYSLSESGTVSGVYTLDGAGSFPYSAGDSVRVTVPGAVGGFPAGQIALRLAEPISLGPITAPQANEDLPISWSANGDANSGVIISLRYTSSLSSTLPDAQVLCVVRDNGAYTISTGFLGLYFSSNPASRQLNVLRWRTNSARIDDRTNLYIVSTVDTTVVLQ